MPYRYYPRIRSTSRRMGVLHSRLIFKRRFRRARRVGRMMRRRRARPELKYATIDRTDVTLAANSRETRSVSPIAMVQGTAEGQRIGGSVKFFRITGGLSMRSDVAQPAQPSRPDGILRFLFWTPRIAQAEAQAYMDLVGFNEPVDYNVATVHKDTVVSIGYPEFQYTGVGLTGTVAGSNPISSFKFWKFTFKFPRTVTFRPGDDDVDINKDVMYITVFNVNTFQVVYNFTFRTTYIDA